MPSLFEPCGIVQDEFFVAGTPVIAFNTGGLKVLLLLLIWGLGNSEGLEFWEWT